MGVPTTAEPPDYRRPYHGRVLRLADLPDVIREYGVPGGEVDDDYEGTIAGRSRSSSKSKSGPTRRFDGFFNERMRRRRDP
jgi:hypothetical protein